MSMYHIRTRRRETPNNQDPSPSSQRNCGTFVQKSSESDAIHLFAVKPSICPEYGNDGAINPRLLGRGRHRTADCRIRGARGKCELLQKLRQQAQNLYPLSNQALRRKTKPAPSSSDSRDRDTRKASVEVVVSCEVAMFPRRQHCQIGSPSSHVRRSCVPDLSSVERSRALVAVVSPRGAPFCCALWCVAAARAVAIDCCSCRHQERGLLAGHYGYTVQKR